MLKKLLQYKEWALIILLICGWISTYLYDRKTDKDAVKQLEEINELLKKNDANWDAQFEFNGRVSMYIELDTP